jgi:stage V sporulation protein R
MLLSDKRKRTRYDTEAGLGRKFIFAVRENYADSMFINSFVDQDFVDLHKLFVVGKRLNKERMTWQYYVKSRKAEDYKAMVSDSLYHPPSIVVNVDESGTLVLNHVFEGKPLVREYIDGTMLGLEFLWGGKICLYTSEPVPIKPQTSPETVTEQEKPKQEISWKRFRYIMDGRKLSRELVDVHGKP